MKKLYVAVLLYGCFGGSLNAAAELPLHVAARAGDIARVRTLLERGAVVDEKGAFGVTALLMAAGEGHQKVVKLLLKNGAALDGEGLHAWTALHVAVDQGHRGVAELLLDNGANIHAREVCRGDTPLHIAACKGHRGVVELLLSRGADPTILNVNGNRAVGLIVYSPEPEQVQQLEQLLRDASSRPEATAIAFILLRMAELPKPVIQEVLYKMYPSLADPERLRKETERGQITAPISYGKRGTKRKRDDEPTA